MDDYHVLNHADILDGSGKLRTIFHPPDESGWIPHGRYSVVEADGHVVLKITYHHGTAHGPYVDYWSNGKVSLEGQYLDGQQHGVWHFYNNDGTLREIIQFDMGKEVPLPLRHSKKS